MLSTFEDSSEKSIHDISKIMEARKNLKQMYVKMLVPGLFMEALEVASLVYGILRGNWIPFAAVMVLVCIHHISLLAQKYYVHLSAVPHNV
jgi:hypothetical protein